MRTCKKEKRQLARFFRSISLPSESHIPSRNKSFQLKIKAMQTLYSFIRSIPSPQIFPNQTTLKQQRFFISPAQQASLPFGMILGGPQLQSAVGDSLQGRQADESFSLCHNRTEPHSHANCLHLAKGASFSVA